MPPRKFDTGASAPMRTILRSHIVARLARLLRTDPSGRGFVTAILPFGGVVRSYTDELGIDELYTLLNGRAPAIAVGLGDKNYKAAGAGGYQFTSFVDVHVYFASMHSRSLFARQAGDFIATVVPTLDPGIDVMMELTEDLLIGERARDADGTFSPAIKSLKPKREEELATSNDITLWVQTYEAELTRTIDEHRDVTQKVTGFMTTLTTVIANDQAVLVFNTNKSPWSSGFASGFGDGP